MLRCFIIVPDRQQDFSPAQRRHWSISADGQASLTITRVAKNDEGLWECWELDGVGNPKRKAHALHLVVAKSKSHAPEEDERRRKLSQALYLDVH